MSRIYQNALGLNPGTSEPAPSIGLVRPRLLGHLDSLERKTVGLVVAPAGSGKSTLIRQFASLRTSSRQILQLSPADVRPGAFLASLLRRCGPADRRFEPGRTDEMLAQEIVDNLTIAAAVADQVLIVDDMHVIEDTPALALFGEILAQLPRNIRTLIGSRCVPGIDLTRLRLDDDIVEVGSDDLRFRSWEMEQLFAEEYATWLAPKELSRLARATDGWAAGLKLFHLATVDRTDAERNVELERLCSSRSHTVRDYLTRNVLSSLSPDTQEFMIRTSVLGLLTPRTCDALLGSGAAAAAATDAGELTTAEPLRSAAILDELDRRQLFTERRESGYRYHEVLRGHLEALLAEELSADELRRWYSTAAHVLEEHHSPGDAIRAFVCAGDVDGALRNLGEAGSLVGRETGWIERLPAGLVEHDPWVALVRARHLVAEGHPEQGLHAYQALIDHARTTDAGQIASREMGELRRWIDANEQPPDPGSWLSLLRSALRRDPDNARLSCARIPGVESLVAVGLTALLDGNFLAARSAFTGAVTDGVLGEVVAVGRAITQWLVTGRDPSQVIVRIRDRADRESNQWMARMLSAILLAFPEPSHAPFNVQFSEITKPAADAGDRWSPAFGKLFAGLGYALATDSVLTQEEAVGLLTEAACDFEDLGANVLGAWAEMVKLSLQFDGSTSADALTTTTALERRTPDRSEIDRVLAKVEQAGATLPCRVLWQIADMASSPLPPGNWSGGLANWIRSAPSERRAPSDSAPTRAMPGSTTVERTSEVRVFGGFHLVLDGDVIDCHSLKPRARSVLRILVVRSGEWVHRDELLDALWSETLTTSSINSLHVCLTAVRRALGRHSELLRREGEAYRFDDVATHDLHRFVAGIKQADAARRSGALDRALGLIGSAIANRGDLLPDEGSPDWLVAQRNSLTGLVVRTCSAIAADALCDKNNSGAVIAAELGLASDPFNDELWNSLRNGLERSGRVAEAARVQQGYEHMLGDLGLLPPLAKTMPETPHSLPV